MRIYAVADIHGKTDKLEIMKTVIHEEKPDLLILAGDMTQYGSFLKTIVQLENLAIPVFSIQGNSDLKRTKTLIRDRGKITLLNHRPTKYGDKIFLGLNGTIPLPFLSKVCLNEPKRFRRIEKSITRQTILVVHPPPRGILDRVGNHFSAGSFCLRQLIEKHPPLMVVCGHVHEQAGYQFLRNTLIVNCAMNKKFNGAIIHCGKSIFPKVKMVLNKG